MGRPNIGALLTVVLAAMLAGATSGAGALAGTDDAQAACLTKSPDFDAAPDIGFHKHRIAACTEILATQTAPELRVALLVARAESYFRVKSYVRALQDIETLQGAGQDPARLAYARATNFGAMGYATLALAQIEQAIQWGLHTPQAYALRGGAETYVGRYGEAIADLDLAISENPSLGQAYSLRGLADLELGEIDHALADLDQAIKFNPKSADAYYNRGRAHFALDQYDAAIADFREAGRLKPEEKGPGEYIADVQSVMDQPAASDQDGPAPADSPSRPAGRTHNCGAYYPFLSTRLAESGDVMLHYDVSETGSISGVGLERTSGSERLDRAALVCISRHWRNIPAHRAGVAVATPRHLALIRFVAHDLAPDDTLRGTALAALGRYDEAIAEFSRILAIEPDDADAYFRRGFALYVAQRYGDAARDLDKAIRLKPDFDEAEAARELVRAAAMAQSPVHKDI